MHKRVCLHQVAFAGEPTGDFIAYCDEIGVSHMTLATPMLERDGIDAVSPALGNAKAHVAVVNHPIAMGSDLERAATDEQGAHIRAAIDAASTLGARAIYLVSGGRGSLDWEAAAERFAAIVDTCKDDAKTKGVQLLVEPAMAFNADMHIAHTLDDTIRLAEIADIGVCIDLQQIWFESGLKQKFARAMPRTGLVQVSDYVFGDRCTPCRAVPGDGNIPLETLIGDVLELGYEGVFDLELLGPRIEEEGPRSACKRSARNLSAMLERLGA